jgi:hypothetical protein
VRLSIHTASAENKGNSTLTVLLAAISDPSYPLLVADFPHMNFTQMHERLRLELLRRIQRGTLSVSLLARQTGFQQSHLSNFLHCRRQLSLDGLDRVLAAQQMGAADLLPAAGLSLWQLGEETSYVPVVSHATAMNEPVVRRSAVRSLLWVPDGLLHSTRSHAPAHRHSWQRFVAIQVPPADAMAMDPLIQPDAIALLDRQYNSLAQYRPSRPNIYALRKDAHLKLRYADFLLSRLVLRPHNRAFPVELTDLAPGETPNDLIIGRVILILNEH